MRIAIFDYKVIPGNPCGSCHLALLRSLCHEHEFTVFSVNFENPNPERIAWVRIPCPTRPLALLFLTYHLFAPVAYLLHRLRTHKRFDLVQSVESNLSFGDLIYSHFSHKTYLRRGESSRRSLREFLRWADNLLHSWGERLRYRSPRLIVTPSAGLAEELVSDFGVSRRRLCVIPNPVRVTELRRPPEFDRESFRHSCGYLQGDLVYVFAALGHFERKGLPILIQSFASDAPSNGMLLVVGGERDVVAHWREVAAAAGAGSRIRFVGMQSDIRPYLWAADAFILPSSYETFSLAAYEAAAAGLPVLAPPLSGISELLRDQENGFLVSTDVASVTNGLRRLASLSPAERSLMGERARRAAASFSEERFAEHWRALYSNWRSARHATDTNSSVHGFSSGTGSRLHGASEISYYDPTTVKDAVGVPLLAPERKYVPPAERFSSTSSSG
jgi:glycosyltransferase involved in cell wall biosynthesis